MFEYSLVPRLNWIGCGGVVFFIVVVVCSFSFFERLNQIFKVDSMAMLC